MIPSIVFDSGAFHAAVINRSLADNLSDRSSCARVRSSTTWAKVEKVKKPQWNRGFF